MTVLQENIEVVDQLEIALNDGRIPSNYERWCTNLLTHLRQPLQIGFVGQADSGKSSLIAMMLGRADLPVPKGAGFVEIVYGPAHRTTLEYADGTQEHFDELIEEAPNSQPIERARLELPDDLLLRQSLMKWRLDGSPESRETMLRRAVQSSAILVYCSDEFGTEDRDLWSAVPDEVKDHSFLVLTKADRRIGDGCLARRIAELEPVVSEEFLGLFPIATLQAVASRSGGKTVQPDLWKSSGGKDLHDVIQRKIDLGRTEDLDQAGMLLAQFMPRPEKEARPASTGAAHSDEKGASPDRDVASEVRPDVHTRYSVLRPVLDQLKEFSEQLVAYIKGPDQIDPADITDKCVEVISDISNTLEEAECDDPVVQGICEDARESEQMMMLLQIENGVQAATDAVILLTQLRKEISLRACG